MEETDITPSTHCYCNAKATEMYMISCSNCKRLYHRGCLDSGTPSILAGDIYYKLICKTCSEDGKEFIERVKLQWTLVVILALFNLQLKSSGKCGYFRWREDICKFIDQHWITFFGADRKKAATWHHTVAGTLSSNCHKYFLSGAEVLGEKGWWALKDLKLPTIDELEALANVNKANRKSRGATNVDPLPIIEGTRRRQNVLEAALELKAKRTATDGPDYIRKPKKKKMRTEESMQVKITLSKNTSDVNCSDMMSQASFSSSDYDVSNSSMLGCRSEPDYWNDNPNMEGSSMDSSSLSTDPSSIAQWLTEQNIHKGGLDLPINIDPPSEQSDLLDATIMEGLVPDANRFVPSVKTENNSDSEQNFIIQPTTKTTVGNQKKILENQHLNTSRKRKVVIKEEKPIKEMTIVESKFRPLTVYEEQHLLLKLESLQPLEDIQARNLYRKLVVRKLKRENNQPIFDLDNHIRNACGLDPLETNFFNSGQSIMRQEILDRYQTFHQPYGETTNRSLSFVSRLMGLEDDEQENIVSPYTTRVLRPFIFRDHETMSQKLKLLHQIVAYPHRDDPDWVPPKRYPIDYSYVRTQHIPAVNALCQEFFWPGIDLSESLQYPDFSCIALYRKLVVGFAFMVPDVKYNEAYITFIFCHPEWRRCGIATFMLYHLIQTCMGKDITLHVSAKNSAVLLYQKFGFKVEEYILDFYDKYLPATSKESRHALFLRLNR